MPEPGLYVYGVLAADSPATRAPLGSGIDGAPLTLVSAGDVAAVAHRHPGAPYGDEDGEVRRRVLEHNAVVDRLWQADRAILPMTFDVIVAGTAEASAERRLEGWLRSSADAIRGGLRAVEGRAELHVDLALDAGAAADRDSDVQALRSRIALERPGVARLLRKRLEGLERDAADRAADAIYPQVRARLARWSADLVENLRAKPGEGQVLVLSAALLVRESEVERVGDELAALAEGWPALRIRFLGPWPPYSFARLRPAARD